MVLFIMVIKSKLVSQILELTFKMADAKNNHIIIDESEQTKYQVALEIMSNNGIGYKTQEGYRLNSCGIAYYKTINKIAQSLLPIAHTITNIK